MQLRGGQRGPSRRGEEAVALALLAVGVSCFGLIALVVHHDWLVHLDRAILLWFRTDGDAAVPLGPHGLISFMRDVTALGSFAVLSTTVLAVSGFLAMSGNGNRALAVLGFTIGGTLCGETAKHLFSRIRPDVVPHLVEVMTLSFPSAHAMQATVVWLTFAVLLAGAHARRGVQVYLVAVAAIVALAVGLSRVYLGVHWPTDVLAGWVLGIAWVAACWLLDRRLCRRRV